MIFIAWITFILAALLAMAGDARIRRDALACTLFPVRILVTTTGGFIAPFGSAP